MAKILRFPAQHVIDGLKGKLDFYVHDGQACVRTWPKSPGRVRAPAVMAQWAAFSAASRVWASMSPSVQAAYNHMAGSSRWSGRDLATRSYLANLYRYELKKEVVLSQIRAYLSAADQSIPNTTYTKVTLDGETFDVLSEFDNAVNYRFTAKTAGYYLATGHIRYKDPVADKSLFAVLYKNGVLYTAIGNQSAYTSRISTSVIDLIYLAIGDFIELWTWHDCGVAEDIQADETRTFLTVHGVS